MNKKTFIITMICFMLAIGIYSQVSVKKTIPQQIIDKNLRDFKITIEYDSETGTVTGRIIRVVLSNGLWGECSVSSVWSQMTPTQRNIVAGFVMLGIKEALNVTDADLTGTFGQ